MIRGVRHLVNTRSALISRFVPVAIHISASLLTLPVALGQTQVIVKHKGAPTPIYGYDGKNVVIKHPNSGGWKHVEPTDPTLIETENFATAFVAAEIDGIQYWQDQNQRPITYLPFRIATSIKTEGMWAVLEISSESNQERELAFGLVGPLEAQTTVNFVVALPPSITITDETRIFPRFFVGKNELVSNFTGSSQLRNWTQTMIMERSKSLKDDSATPESLLFPVPLLPSQLMQKGISGSVSIECELSADGVITSHKIIQISDNRLREPVLESLRYARFFPRILSGRRTESKIEFIVPLNAPKVEVD